MQPAPFNYDVSVDERYAQWQELWLSFNNALPKVSDIEGAFSESYEQQLAWHRTRQSQEMFDYLDKYISSDNPAHNYFALYILSCAVPVL